MAGTNLITVYNRALFKIGVSAMTNPSESTPQARIATALFSTVAQTELRKHAWSFALARASLASTGVAPAFGYAYAYNLPSDFLRLVYLNGLYVDPTYREITEGAKPAYVIEGNELLTDNGPPQQIRYVRDLSGDTTLWDACFVDVDACALAIECAPNLTKSEKTVQRVFSQYKQAVFDAKRVNAIELPPNVPPDASWMTTRAF